MAFLLGTDIGAQSIKVALFHDEGGLVSLEQIPYPIGRPSLGWAEGNPEIWWESFCKGVKSAIEGKGVQGKEIESIGISTMCPSLVALDGQGNPLRPAILYLDQRSIPQARMIQERIGLNKVFEITGNRIAPGTYSVTSILWIKENEPHIFEKTRFFGHGNTFLAHRLTGHFAFDWASASFTGLFRTGDQRSWSQELCKELQIPMELLPDPVISSFRIGSLNKEASRATGLTQGIPVAIGGADTACSALGAGVVDPGQVFESSGTSEVLSFCSDRPRFDIRFMNRCHVVPDRWLLMGAMLSPGAALSWFRDQFCLQEKKVAQDLGLSAHQIMDLEAHSSPPGANGLLFLPYMRGERSPIWDAFARGVFCGLSLDTTKGDMIRSILEGTAYGIRQNMEIAEQDLGLKVRDLKVVGGGSISPIWGQIKADVLKKNITTLTLQETAVLGAAMLGGMASGRYMDFRDSIAKASARTLKSSFPEPEVSSIYDQMYASYLSLYLNTKGIFEQLSKIRSSIT